MGSTLAIPCSVLGPTVSLFHIATGIAFADLVIEAHRETWPIRGKQFRAWLRHRHYEQTGEAASAEAIRSTVDLLEARALFDAPERTVNIRVAEHSGRIYLDLADTHWHAVEIGPEGWRVVSYPPVRFRRAAGMLPLPTPQRGGCIETLAPFLNLPGSDEFVLVMGWLLAALRPIGPYPLLAIAGEQGSAKTVLTKILRALVDPNAAPARPLPRDERELMIAATNGHILAFDNLSGLPPWVSDALCRLASGSSMAVRRLYTDEDEVLFRAARPTILNGIDEIVCRADLADRAIFLVLNPIRDEQRRTEEELWRQFDVARPRMLGALLDAVAHGLRRLPQLHSQSLLRMADFALWAGACETAFVSTGTVVRAYKANRHTAIEGIIDADPVALFVREIMADRSAWAGSASDLLRLHAAASEKTATARPAPGWLKNPRVLANRLRRSQTLLRHVGVDITFAREGRAGARIIRMTSLAGSQPQSHNQRALHSEAAGFS
jgi:hypothetical protein